MFTGIIEEVGRVRQIKRGQHSAVLTLQARTVLEHTKIGDSIAVNGICLTVTQMRPDGFSADVMHETLERSALTQLTVGSSVNLERAMPANGRFGGHIVAGHVDGVGHIAHIRRDDTAVWYTILCSSCHFTLCGGKRLCHDRRDQPDCGGGRPGELLCVHDPPYGQPDQSA